MDGLSSDTRIIRNTSIIRHKIWVERWFRLKVLLNNPTQFGFPFCRIMEVWLYEHVLLLCYKSLQDIRTYLLFPIFPYKYGGHRGSCHVGASQFWPISHCLIVSSGNGYGEIIARNGHEAELDTNRCGENGKSNLRPRRRGAGSQRARGWHVCSLH